jgi:hypothetical protein
VEAVDVGKIEREAPGTMTGDFDNRVIPSPRKNSSFDDSLAKFPNLGKSAFKVVDE